MTTTSDMPHPRVGVAAPSDNMLPTQDLLRMAVGLLENHGFTVIEADNILHEYGRFAGTHESRAGHFQKMAMSSAFDTLLMASGGYGALHILPYLDFSRMNPHLDWVGYSDSTVLLNARVAHTGKGGWHGAMLKQLAKGFESLDRALVKDILAGTSPHKYEAEVLADVKILNEGQHRGRLIGGNVAAFRSLMGTPHAPQPQAGDILFLEELDDDLCRVDRDLHHLAQNGWFEQLGGLIYGDFSEMHESTSRPFGFSLYEVFAYHGRNVNGPVVSAFPAGHTGLNLPLPIGKAVTLTAGTDGTTLSWEN
ncbi:MAG: LD-carboxypeptidase [Blastochloris viridis]|uniref:LD-carboxypeptidase n=1 Tax=Blastochloris viridis TaxID=1079 RepID=A0A6N4RA26_BLAVI|nr:MAG: LD-carboxypeptidase [Blastochloris viridis]